MGAVNAQENRERKIAAVQLETECVLIRPEAPFTYTSGLKGPIYCDNRGLLSFPHARNMVIEAYLALIAENNIQYDVLGGVATAGIPWASILADRIGKPLIYIREKAKVHGRQNQIEGRLEKGQRVLIIEDHISTGGSSIKAINAVKEAGGIVEYCLAISTHEMQKAEEAFREVNCKLRTATRFTVTLKEAITQQKIQKEQEAIVIDWNKNPENWGEKYGFQ